MTYQEYPAVQRPVVNYSACFVGGQGLIAILQHLLVRK